MKRFKTILITGANRGIGLQATKELSELGHTIILTSRDEKKGMLEAKKISKNIISHKLDVTKEEDIIELKSYLTNHKIILDVIINNGGAIFDNDRYESNEKNPLDTSITNLRNSLDVFVVGAYSLIQHLFPLINKKERADIINISSGMGALKDMGTGFPAYRISKTALNAMTVYLSAELKDTNIHANSICPGWVKTDMGGPNATRSLSEGVKGILWIINEEPNINGKFIRDKNIIDF